MSADWGRCKSTKLYNFLISGELCRTSLKAVEAVHCSGNSERPPVEFAEVNKSRLTSGLGKPTAPGIAGRQALELERIRRERGVWGGEHIPEAPRLQPPVQSRPPQLPHSCPTAPQTRSPCKGDSWKHDGLQQLGA